MAVQWNVSPMTVHRALTELQREGWVVRRPKAGTLVADRAAHPLTRVGLIFPTLSESPQSDCISGIEDTLSEGYQLLSFRKNHKPSVEALILERAHGECDTVIIYASIDPANTTMINKLAAHIPMVLVDRLPEGVNADIISTDNLGSILQGLQFLHARGYRRVAYFMEDSLHISAVRERRGGYLQFMAEIGEPVRSAGSQSFQPRRRAINTTTVLRRIWPTC